MQKNKFFILILLFLVSVFLSLKSGPIDVSFRNIFDYLFYTSLPSNLESLFKHIRVPRTIAAFYVGSTLALSGAVLQSILRNSLADSYTLGISGGSALGASVALHLGFSPLFLWIPFLSNIGSLLAISIVFIFFSYNLTNQSRSLILAGVMVSLFFGALSVFSVSLLPVEKSQAALSWLMGEFGSNRDSWSPTFIFFSIPILIFIFLKSKVLNALSLGEVKALSLGYSPRKEKTILILATTILTSLAISLSGLIGFIGLVSPHIARRFLKTSLNEKVLPASFLIGGTLLLFSDTLGRVLVSDKEIPAGSLSALIGAPVLIFLLLEKKHARAE